ncbi:hypothetical protein PCASD_22830 [Puccinia coronata f. sp. avenae]|nr:hypothetical protein PCASD_22830 [Puccinia coronata f. sp. avenae]
MTTTRSRARKREHSSSKESPPDEEPSSIRPTSASPDSSDSDSDDDLQITGETNSATQTDGRDTATPTTKNRPRPAPKAPSAAAPKTSEDSSAKRARKTTSNIWDHFTAAGEGEKKKAICKYC